MLTYFRNKLLTYLLTYLTITRIHAKYCKLSEDVDLIHTIASQDDYCSTIAYAMGHSTCDSYNTIT